MTRPQAAVLIQRAAVASCSSVSPHWSIGVSHWSLFLLSIAVVCRVPPPRPATGCNYHAESLDATKALAALAECCSRTTAPSREGVGTPAGCPGHLERRGSRIQACTGGEAKTGGAFICSLTECEQRGNTEIAIYYYGKLIDLWKDADPELQPQVEAARRTIEASLPTADQDNR